MFEHFGRWLRRQQGVERNPIYRLANEVMDGQISVERAYQMVENPQILGSLADGDLWELDPEVTRAADVDQEHALILTRMVILAARYKGFDRLLVEFNLKASDLLGEQENYREQELHLREAMHAAERIANTAGQRRALARLARLAMDQGNNDQAKELLHRQLEVGREETDAPEDVETAVMLGDISFDEGDIQGAHDNYLRASRSAKRISHYAGMVDALMRQLSLHRAAGDNEAAMLVLQQAQEAAERTIDTRLQAEIAIQAGIMLAERNQYQPAREQLSMALERTRNIEDLTMEARSLTGLARIERQAGRPADAAKHYRELAELERGLGNRTAATRSLVDAAEVLVESQQPREALQMAEEARPMLAEIDDPRLYHRCLGVIGMIYTGMDRVNEAISHLGDASQYAARAGDRAGEARWLAGLGEALVQFGRMDDASLAIERCGEIAVEIDDQSLQGRAIAVKASIFLAEGRVEEAEEYLKRAMSIARNAGDRESELRYLEMLVYSAKTQGHADSALRYLREAVDLADLVAPADVQARLHGRLARWYQTAGQLRDAEEHYKVALEAAEQVGSTGIMLRAVQGLANVQDIAGKLDEAVASYRHGIEIAEQAGDQRNQMALNYNVGALLYDHQDDEPAYKHLSRATELAMRIGDYQTADAARELLSWVTPETGREDESQVDEDLLIGEIALRDDFSRYRSEDQRN
jgi:tetratricopeptide (TPR) repeat protein